MASNIIFVLLSLHEIFRKAKQNSSYSFITHLCLCIYVDLLLIIEVRLYIARLFACKAVTMIRFVSHSFAHQCICVVVLHRQFVAIYGPLWAIVRLR